MYLESQFAGLTSLKFFILRERVLKVRDELLCRDPCHLQHVSFLFVGRNATLCDLYDTLFSWCTFNPLTDKACNNEPAAKRNICKKLFFFFSEEE